MSLKYHMSVIIVHDQSRYTITLSEKHSADIGVLIQNMKLRAVMPGSVDLIIPKLFIDRNLDKRNHSDGDASAGIITPGKIVSLRAEHLYHVTFLKLDILFM